MVIPIFVPHQGCPYDCIFCNQKIISGQINEASEQDIRGTIETHLSTADNGTFIEIAFYGGSFTGIPLTDQIRYLEIGYSYVKSGRVRQMRVSTRPDYINHETLELLKKYKVEVVELGAQSLDNEVLRCSNRGHDMAAVARAAKMVKEKGFTLGIQTMLGLPGDNREKAILTARRVVDMSPDIVRIYPTLVIKDTFLLKMYLEGSYSPLSLDEAVDICADLLSIYEQHNIHVIRIGLQPTENINEEGEVVAGPFHPAFRQLVQSRLLLNQMVQYIDDHHLDNAESIRISCHQKQISNIVGQKRSNIHQLKNRFNFKEVTILPEDRVDLFSIEAGYPHLSN